MQSITLFAASIFQGLKNHAVTMFEVGKLCDESMDTFLSELEKVSLLDAEGEGEVSRYFAHAVSNLSYQNSSHLIHLITYSSIGNFTIHNYRLA